jgi:hypothetical protein
MGQAQRAPLSGVRDLIIVGQPLPFHVHDEFGRRLLAAGQVILGDTQLEMLLERGAWVDSEEAANVRRDRQAAAGGGGSPVMSVYREPTLFDRWEKLVWELDALLRKVIAGMPCAPELEGLGRQLLAQVERDIDVALFMTIRPADNRFALYALQHALHAATVGVVLSKQLAWSIDQQLRLVLGALTMNVSILELQAQMAAEKDPPTMRQRQIVRAHPETSAAMLQTAGVTDAEWLVMVREHHERPDGTGYPSGAKGIGELAHALRLVDVFTAKISPRAFRPALSIQVAARQMFQEELGGSMAAGMIKALGLYPPGDLVQLKNGEIAVVARRGPSATTPLVASLTNAAGQPIAATSHRDTAKPEFAITGPAGERKGLSRVLPERVYGLMN